MPAPTLNSSPPTNAPQPEPELGVVPVNPWQKWLKRAAWTLLFGATATISATAGAALVLAIPLPKALGGHMATAPLSDLWKSGFRYQVSRPVNILVMGVDEALDIEGAQPDSLAGRTDTMLLVRLDPETGSANILSIPRDTQVDIPGYGIDKVNQANVEGGAQLSAQTVSVTLGDVKIDRYVRVSTGAFREIIDQVGGIEVFVPKAMQYEDKTQGLVIDLEPGWQTLNGDQAEQFARFRQDAYGDIGRVQRQQMLLKALKDRMTNPAVITQLPQIIRVLQSYIDTNLSPEEMLALAGFGLELTPESLHMVMLPGRFSEPGEFRASYWIMDSDATAKVMQDFFAIASDQKTLVSEEPTQERPISRLSIAIQNASTDADAAQLVADQLREEGFRNVYIIEDWPDTLRETSIIAQRGDLSKASTLQMVLGVGQVASESTGDLESDMTLRIGQDWVEQYSQSQ
jgi:polyisoprenyl-teichoic acid--peptidoglycan teichoic acid transferase